jgi:hypothetical protein
LQGEPNVALREAAHRRLFGFSGLRASATNPFRLPQQGDPPFFKPRFRTM